MTASTANGFSQDTIRHIGQRNAITGSGRSSDTQTTVMSFAAHGAQTGWPLEQATP